jgi:hypothetical protein
VAEYLATTLAVPAQRIATRQPAAADGERVRLELDVAREAQPAAPDATAPARDP